MDNLQPAQHNSALQPGTQASPDEEREFRKMISIAFLACFLMFLVGSAVLGILDGSFNELNVVWSTGAFWVGFIIQYHLK